MYIFNDKLSQVYNKRRDILVKLQRYIRYKRISYFLLDV